MKKVLIITYYWPPAGGPGVQRVLKFAKYLPMFGWKPIVLTVKKGEYSAIDESLVGEIPNNCYIFKTNSIEPNSVYKKFVGIRQDQNIPVAILAEENPNWKKKIANWIRLNCFIPDAKIGWKYYALKKAREIIKDFQPDLIISSSPPQSVHLIAKNLAGENQLPWVADFRDPWTDIYYYQKIKRIGLSKRFDKYLERSVLKRADNITTVSNDLARLFNDKHSSDKIKIIPNGFDTEDFININRDEKYEKFTIVYTGKLNAQQNPVCLWRALQKLTSSITKFAENFQMIFMGNFSNDIYNSLQNYKLKPFFVDLGYVDHVVSIKNMNKADIKLLIIPNTPKNKGILTGKLFDYIATDGFTLGIGPKDGDAAQILNELGTGQMIEFSDNPEDIILEQFRKWQKGDRIKADFSKSSKYSRKNLTKKLVNIFEQLVIK